MRIPWLSNARIALYFALVTGTMNGSSFMLEFEYRMSTNSTRFFFKYNYTHLVYLNFSMTLLECTFAILS